jgi:RNA polymerase-binding protein DksA
MSATNHFRKQLLEQRAALLRQVARAEDDLRWLDSNVEPEMMDEGQEKSLALVLTRLDDRGKAEIEAIDRALARIAADSFGTCTSCGEPIATARLQALPTAERCLECARADESQHG